MEGGGIYSAEMSRLRLPVIFYTHYNYKETHSLEQVHAWFDAKKGDRQTEREFIIDQQSGTSQAAGEAEAPKTLADMPPGMTKMQEAAWKKTHGL